MSAAEKKAAILSCQRMMKALQARAAKILIYVQSFDVDQEDPLQLETRRDAVFEMRKTYYETEQKLFGLLKDDELDAIWMQREEFFDLVNEILYQIAKKLKPLSNPPEAKPSLDSSIAQRPGLDPSIKLPEISLPKFNGHYDQWIYFRNQFNHLVRRNEALNDTQRLHYLRSCLVDDAKNFESSEESFSSLWKALEQQFENRRWLVDHHLAELLQMAPLENEESTSLQKLLNVVQKNLRALSSLKLNLDPLSEAMVVHVVLSRLHPDTHKAFESHVVGQGLVKWSDMAEFLLNRCRMLENLELERKKASVHLKPAGAESRSRSQLQPRVLVSATRDEEKRSFGCFNCTGSHYINECRSFLALPVKQRFQRVKEMKLCVNCFSNRHIVANCKSGSCKKCGQRHNTLLHFDPKLPGDGMSSQSSAPSVPPRAIQGKVNQSQDRVGLCTLTSPIAAREQPAPGPEARRVDPALVSKETPGPAASESRSVEPKPSPKKVQLISTSGQALLHTAIVNVQGANGDVRECRAVLDSCAMTSFMTTECAQRLRLKTFPANVSIVGFGGSGHGITEATVAHVLSNSSVIEGLDVVVEFLVAPCIVNRLPLRAFDISTWNIPEWIDLADPHFNQPEKIDILFGIVEWDKMMLSQTHKLGDDLPTLRRTIFGWVAGGPVNEEVSYPTLRALPVTNEQLDEQLTKFWEVESYSTERFLSPEEQAAEDHFVTTHRRDEKGRYVVALPFKQEEVKLGDSAHIAHRRFLLLEARLVKDQKLYDDYRKFMREYIELGHMERVGTFSLAEQQESPYYFLPHHAVVRPESSTTKLRVVFDASAKTSNGQSLNDQLLVGPTLQPRLIDNLLCFRTYKVAVTSDVAKMFRQIDVRREDRRFQQILWRTSPDEDIGIYQLTTVTYGTACAPFLATRALLQTCLDEAEQFPLAATFGKNSVYMDDVLFGAETVEEALEMQRQLTGMLGKAGFELHKWCSNRSELLADLPEDKLEQKVLFTEEGKTKTLGITWQPDHDVFSFDIHSIAFSEGAPTKRKVLSDISKFFDPCGLAAPVIMTGKIYMQDLWRGKKKWDEALQEDLAKLWIEFRDELSEMKPIRISRCVLPLRRTVFVELIGFSDASQKGYGANLYVRSVNHEGRTAIRLLCAKSHVAPLKEQRALIPRLEVCGCDKLAQLVDKVKRSLPIEFDRTTCYTDSTIALSWINTCPSKLEPFIANRVARILRLTNKSDWFHCRSEDNPADLISRGIMPGQLATCGKWWKGPPFMVDHRRPTSVQLIPEEQLPGLLVVCAVEAVERFSLFDNCEKYFTMVRVVARIQRWHQNACKRSSENRRHGRLFNPEEMRQATLALVRLAQEEAFPEVFAQLRKQVTLQNHSLIPLSPFVDDHGVLRVGGRLSKSSCSYDTKHQMILPKKHPLTVALIRDKHTQNMHAGVELTLAAVRREFWIIRGRVAVKDAIGKCVVCFEDNPRPVRQYMGDLPACRLEGRYPFHQVGIDLCGPVFVKQRNKRSTVQHKAWIVLFVCLSTKAIHLELVSELSTAAFLAAFDRFVSRRGRPAVVWTDNGTNFVGAANLLAEWDKFFASVDTQDEIQRAHSNEITWRFNPPEAPHFGGIWESNIRQAKRLLVKHTAGAALCFEEMSTVLARIEAILNSRPITPLSDDPEDFEPLTPGHFLVFRPLNAVARPDVDRSKHARSRYEHITKIVQHFWDRWHFEYLTSLQQRYKWHNKIAVQVGQLVLIKRDNMPVQKWLLGRIVELFPGADEVTRVVKVKTKDGILKRAVSKLCFLPIDPENGVERPTFQRREDV